MGITSSLDESERIIGVDEAGKYIRLKDILDRHKDLEHMLKYTRNFMDHHMELQGNETNYQTEIFYAKNVLALVKPYAPENLSQPEFDEKPPSFDGTPTEISDYDFQKFIVDCMEYFAITLSSFRTR
jgi:hypothetical protein